MSFFTDPVISRLTSGTPSQNVDLSGLSFPRRISVKFSPGYIEKLNILGKLAVWSAYEDPEFKNPLKGEFIHEDLINTFGWTTYLFKGIIPGNRCYIKLNIKNPDTGMLIKSFFFRFDKSYMTTLDGRAYIKDQVLGEKIIRDGVLTEMIRYKTRDGKIVIRDGNSKFTEQKIMDVLRDGELVDVQSNVIADSTVKYAEKQKMVFLITPPHMMSYAKIILILLKQLVDLNFDQSYMGKSDQKPLFKTRYMIDELGNLQSDGHGISNFETLLSIGLGQDQQFTLILQTLQQLKDVYGDSVDKIVQGNTSNIVFLKSPDDSMIETLSKMSGTRHVTEFDGKSVKKDLEKLWLKTSGEVSYNINTKEVPVISYNDLAFIKERNSIVFRTGTSPIWNKNQTALIMSWRMFKNTIKIPGRDFTLKTIPTTSTAMEFDLRKNQPDFLKMVEERLKLACYVDEIKEKYKDAYNYTDYEISQLDDDVYSSEIMELLDSIVNEEDDRDNEAMGLFCSKNITENTDQINITNSMMQNKQVNDRKIYAGKKLAKSDIVVLMGDFKMGYNHGGLDEKLIATYRILEGQFASGKDKRLVVENGNLINRETREVYIRKLNTSEEAKALAQAATEEKTRVFSDMSEEDIKSLNNYEVTDSFFEYLIRFSKWDFLGGEFDRVMSEQIGDVDFN